MALEALYRKLADQVRANDVGVRNVALSAVVAADTLTVSLKTLAGSDPSTGDKISLAFRNATLATGDQQTVDIASALSLTISSGSSLGTANGSAFRLWIVIFNDGGTLRLGLVNCLSGASILRLRPDVIFSSTSEGGAGAADSAQTIYTDTAVTSKALLVLGYLEWSSGLATAGIWSSGPTKVQIFGPGVPLPGDPVQEVAIADSAWATGTTGIPIDNTIPQITEGTQFLSLSITPTAAMNLLRVRTQGKFRNNSGGGANVMMALFRDSGANALAAAHQTATSNFAVRLFIEFETRSESTSATTFKMRAGTGVGESSPSYGFNGTSSSAELGGSENSYMRIHEVMA